MGDIINIKSREKIQNSCAIPLKRPFNFGQAAAAPTPKKKRQLLNYWQRKAILKTWLQIRNFIYRPLGRVFAVQAMQVGLRLNREDFNVFIRTSGHVDSLQIEIHPGGWSKGGGVKIYDDYLPGYRHSVSSPLDMIRAINKMKLHSRLQKL